MYVQSAMNSQDTPKSVWWNKVSGIFSPEINVYY